ncbi:hypothetical protein N7510_004226 [Penicillium lagena]|uniref:uncharacterized protein n=1 Tax=Penicillium lagena TaxID=94218 RepID=UPI00253F9CE3|nr:uncharacterized protein N7510_004226 [Penicillium lagena]KAJ5620242.1 hypothetical protein N7510_004226 [Penicillium lagena]
MTPPPPTCTCTTPRLADLFEEFTRPHASPASLAAAASSHNLNSNTSTAQAAAVAAAAAAAAAAANSASYGSSSPATIPSFLPIEEIYVSPQYQPSNPEDEDDVVPDQHAAFGITRAMERRRVAIWRDLGLEALVRGQGHGGGSAFGGPGGGGNNNTTTGAGSGPGATLRGSGAGAASAAAPAVRVRSAGRRMGGRRTICLR